MPRIATKTTLTADVAPGGTFTVPYPSGYSQSDFLANDATTSVYGSDHDDLGVSLGASEATITWPSGKPSTLKAGLELTVGLDLVNKADGRYDDLLPHQADSEATDAAGVVSDFNDLLAKLRNSGLMESS